MKDHFTQLVDDLNNGNLTLTMIQIAIRAYVRQCPNTPEEAKSILCGNGDTNPGLIYRQFSLITQTIGGFELAVMRAKD